MYLVYNSLRVKHIKRTPINGEKCLVNVFSLKEHRDHFELFKWWSRSDRGARARGRRGNREGERWKSSTHNTTVINHSEAALVSPDDDILASECRFVSERTKRDDQRSVHSANSWVCGRGRYFLFHVLYLQWNCFKVHNFSTWVKERIYSYCK